MPKAKVQLRFNKGALAATHRETMALLLKRYKLVILGATSVGKSSLVSYYINGKASNVEEKTLVASFSSLSLDKAVKFDAWEVAGEERWQSLAHMYYTDAQAALIVYNVQDRNSYICSKMWIKELRQKLAPTLVIAIAANKIDLWDNMCVDSTEMSNYARDNGYIFMETSAKTGTNIYEIFTAIADELKASRRSELNRFDKDTGCSCEIL